MSTRVYAAPTRSSTSGTWGSSSTGASRWARAIAINSPITVLGTRCWVIDRAASTIEMANAFTP